MIVNPVTLNGLVYPVFKIGTEKPITMNGLSFLMRHLEEKDTGIIKETIQVIDDNTIPKDTLSSRRLILIKEGVPLKALKNSVYFLGDLIKLAKANTWFIDNNGLIFQYKKSKRLKLIFKEIKSVYPMQRMGAIIEVVGIPTRFKVLYEPKSSFRFAGILEDGIGYILYGIYDKKYKDTWRMI